MKKISFINVLVAISITFTIVSCNKSGDRSSVSPVNQKALTEDIMLENGANPDEASLSENIANDASGLNSKTEKEKSHYLYTESNSLGTNHILVYEISKKGILHFAASTSSGGAGSGQALGSQGALVIDKAHEWLYAVNAGSNSVSSFKIHDDGTLSLAHTVASGGIKPVSVSVYGDLLAVLNNGSDDISAFRIGYGGTLVAIEGSLKALSATGVDAPQISFTPGGELVIVTEKATNIVGTFKVNYDGSLSDGVFTTSVGNTPFGFEFSRDRFLIVSNAAGGGAGAGSATSYSIANNGVPEDANGAVANFEAAPCWVAITKHGRFAYVTNTASNTISSYYVAQWGGLYLVQQVAAKTDITPLDIVVAANNFNVYVLNSKSNTIGEYRRKYFGGLEFVSATPGLPAPATGLATY
ncbi:MAG: beta-propeller fold lactonase family protein [Ginsengibacter sp.]